jgi:hypothetical protein
MRLNVGKSSQARHRDLVIVSAHLTEKNTYARLSVWSANKGDEMSPYIPLHKLGLVVDGRPDMATPMSFRLTPEYPKRSLSFYADDILSFQVKQDVDVRGDPLASVKITVYGPVAQRWRGRYLALKRAATKLLSRSGRPDVNANKAR